jgi:hypothetical protein
MMALLAGIKAWYRRRFRGYVAAPVGVGGKGTAWQQHRSTEVGFTCSCHQVLAFTAADYVIRSIEHIPGCQAASPAELAISESIFADGPQNAKIRADMLAPGLHGCHCPVTDARYIKICPHCGLGHWKVAL